MNNKIKLSNSKICLAFVALIILTFSLLSFFANTTNIYSEEKSGEDFTFNYASSGVEAQFTQITSNFNLIKYVPGETTEMYVLVNFISYGNQTFTTAQINRIKNNFNDNISGNNVFSMHEYFYEQSRGKLNVWALFMEHTTLRSESYFKFPCTSQAELTLAYNNEAQIFKDALDENTSPFVFNGKTIENFVCRINFFAGDAISSLSSFWPKNWISYDSNNNITSQGLILYTQRVRSGQNQDVEWYFYVGVICHELTHMMGVADYYSSSDSQSNPFKPVGKWDLMATSDYDNPQTLSPYFRQVTGWFDESEYYDGVPTEIETITSSGTYKLFDSTSQTGVVGYKFGYRNKNGAIEYFMVEFKYDVSNNQHNVKNGYYEYPTRLLVYRINESIKRGNLDSTQPSRCSMYVFRNNNNNTEWEYAGIVDSTNAGYGFVQSFGSTNDADTNLIVYADGTNTKVVINNLVLNPTEKSMSFDIHFVDNSYSINGVITKDGEIYPNVDVYVNNVYKTKTDAQGFYYVTGLRKNDVVSFAVAGSPISQTFTISGDMPNSNFNVISKKDLSFTTKYGLLPISDVDVLVNGEKKGTTNILGQVTVPDVYLGSVITFFHERYDFNPSTITFSDLEEDSFNISLSLAIRDISIQVKMNNLPVGNVGILNSNDDIIATTNSAGIATISNVEIGQTFHFQKTDFDFNPHSVQFTTVNTTLFTIGAVYTKELNEYNLRIIFKDFDDNEITLNSENIAFSLNGNALTFKTPDDVEDADILYVIGDWYFNVSVGDTLQIEKQGYKSYSFVISSADISAPLSIAKVIEVYRYYEHTFNLKDTYDNILSNVKIYKNGVLIGNSTNEGKITLSNVITDDIIRFELQNYDDKEITFDGNDFIDLIVLVPSQVSIKIFIKSFSGEDLILDGINLRINDHSVGYDIVDNYLSLTVRYLDVIVITRNGYVLSDVSVVFNRVEYNSIARKYINVSGAITYKYGEQLNLIFDLIVDGEKVGKTDADGNFSIVNVLEGSELIVESFGFSSQKTQLLENTEELSIEVERTSDGSLLPAYIIFGALALLLFFNILERCFYRKKKH